MKTIKNVIPLAVAVAFFAALNVQAYFDPSVGRWASRDPITDEGFHLQQTGQQIFQVKSLNGSPVGDEDANVVAPNDFLISGGPNAYEFNQNDAIIFVDSFGLSPFCVCILANSDHAWIAVTDLATGQTTTYGRWKIGYGHPAASSSGVLVNMEKGRSYAAKRCVQVQTFTPTINAGYDARNNNCATYASGVWNQVSGESLADRDSILFVGYDSPSVLVNSINQANAGKNKSADCCGKTK